MEFETIMVAFLLRNANIFQFLQKWPRQSLGFIELYANTPMSNFFMMRENDIKSKSLVPNKKTGAEVVFCVHPKLGNL